jgi:hypothetical protein
MPCYTLVEVEVKDKVMAEKALKAMGEEATIEKNANGTYTVTPKSQNYGFRDTFMQEYSVQVATKKAKANGYTVTRKEEQGETVLILRQY